jgi:hypothetical protein
MLLPFVGTVQAQVSPWDYTQNPTSAVYAIPTTVAFNGVDALEAGDWVGAFYMDNGVLECGGAVQWTGTANTAVVAFGNDTLEAPNKNGFSEGEMVHWKFYRSATSTEEEVLSTPELFWTNGDLADVTAFSPAVPPEVCQDINLIVGTRIISTYIEPADLNFKNVMTDILDNLQIAKNSTGATLRKIGPNWVNSIGNLNPLEGYVMQMNGADLLTICGTQVPFDTPIPVVGTRLVSYLHQGSMNAVTAFGSILDNLQIAKNSTGATLRKIGPNWVNTIGNLNAGEGYSVQMNAADNLVYPAIDNSSLNASVKPANTRGHFVWPGGNAVENTWSIYLDGATFDGMDMQPGDEIAILDGNKIVGVRILTGTPFPQAYNDELVAFAWLGNGTPGYTFGNTPTFIAWDQSENKESEIFTVEYNEHYGEEYMGGVFPSINNEYSNAVLEFYSELPGECPELISAVPGQNVVDLTWNAIGSTPTKALETRGHFVWPGGNAVENTWSIYLDGAYINGVTMEPGDEIAILDGDKIVGVRILTGSPFPQAYNDELVAFAWLGNGTPGYTFGNTPTFIAWDQSENMEYPFNSVEYFEHYGEEYMGGVFPSINNEYSNAILHFGGGEPTFNVYFEDGTLIEANVEGTTYQVTGLEDSTEYCFYVTENLEGGVESCQSNVLCATTPPPACQNVVINNFPAAPADVCFGEEVSIDFNGVEVLNAVSVEWTVDPVEAGVFDGLVFDLDMEYDGMVTITVYGEAAPPCEDATMSLTFEVFPLPDVMCPEDFGVCYTVEPFALTGASPEGGEYSGAGVSDGIFNPLMGAIGENEITYTYTDENGCTNSCTFYITLYDLPEVNCPVASAVCVNADPFMLTGATPAGGEYTGAGVADGWFNPFDAGVGEHIITYTYFDVETGCSNWCEFTITVNPLPEVTCPEYEPVCVGSEPFEFPVVPFGVYLDAEYNTITGFDPVEAGTFEIILDVIDENGCENWCFFDIVVMPLPVVECPEFGWVCSGGEYIDFEAVEGGVYTNEAEEVVTGFDPVEAGVFAFTLTVTDEFGCEGFCTFNITVLESAVAFAGADATIAEGESYTIEDATVFNTEIVVWSTYGDGTFDDNTMINPTYYPGVEDIAAGQVTLSLFGGGDCPDVDTMVLYIGEVICPNPAFADAGEDMTVCAGEPIQLNGYVENAAMYFWSTLTGQGEFSDENILDPIYTPGEGDYLIGSVELCLTAVGLENCDDAVDCMTITFNALPEVTLMAYEPVCEGSEEFALYGGMPEGGVYYVDGVEMEMFDPVMAGEYDLLYMYTDENGCTSTAMVMIVVNELPEAECPEFEPVCEGSAMIAFEPVAGGVYTDVDGEEVFGFNPDMAGTYMFTLTVTNEYGCEAMCEFSIMVVEAPMAECPEFDPVCEGSEMIEFPAVEMGVYTDVEGEEVFGFNPDMAGTYMFTLTVTNEYGCEAMCEFSIMVVEAPVVECPMFDPVCEGSEMIEFAEVEGGVYYDVTGAPVEGFDPMVAGNYDFMLEVTNEYGCSASCTFQIVVNPLPYLMYEASAYTICLGETIDVTVTGPEDGAYPYTVEYTVNGFTMTDVIEDSYLEYELTPEMAGTWSFEVLAITDANGCVSVENVAFEVEVLPLTAIITQPVDVEVVYGQPFELMVEAENATGYQWYLNGEMIAGATGDTYSVAMAMPADGGTYYVMVFGECGEVMSEEVTVTVTPETQVIDFLGAVNGMSTYLELIEDDIATILDPVDLYYVEMKNPVMVWTPSNASFAFNEDKGAKVVLNSGWPTSVTVVGYPTLGTLVNLPAGSSYLPVHSRNVVSAADVFEPLGASLFAVFSMDYSGIYWPSYGVYTLQNLIPGSAYLVVMTAPGVADFDVPAVSAMVQKYVNVPTNMTSWNNMVLTATQHNIAFTAEALSGLQIGDVIGAFNEYGQIAGMVEVTSLRDNLVLRAFGDNPATEAVEGFVEGDLITFKVWRNGLEITAEATFAANMPNQNVFAKDGISAVEGLKAGVTAINDLSSELTANLYPNPATDVVNINTNFVISNVKVINYVGQVIFESNPAQEDFQINTSNLVSGMYFVQIENNEGYVITKRLTIK